MSFYFGFLVNPFSQKSWVDLFQEKKLKLDKGKNMTLLTFELASLLVLAVSVPYVLWRKKKALEGF
jgi:hypothetical protein